jgi:hypothetical protein
MSVKFSPRALWVALTALTFTLIASTASATHSWGGYHWARTANPFTLKLSDNVTSTWDAYLATTSSEWSHSTVLHTTIVAGQANPKNCRPTVGQVAVCNSKYGNTGWLGIASISITGGTHITQGSVKVNDTYFSSATYNTPAWRNLVMCQEVGHTFGLDHQDTTFDNTNLGTCMDYTNDPDGTVYHQLSNEQPNQHDYEELAYIYQHLDSSSTVGQAVNLLGAMGDFNSPSEWGRLVRASADGRNAVYELDFGNGHRIYTFVIWALESDSHRPR